MSQMSESIKRAQEKRDQRIKDWLAEGHNLTWISNKLKTSRQRIQQIAARLAKAAA